MNRNKILCLLIIGYTLLFCPIKVEALDDGFVVLDNKTYYYEEGYPVKGFKEIDGKTYFFSRVDGSMRTGIFSIDYVMYWFDDNGVMQTGWYEEDGKKYYFDEDGKRASGFRTIGENTYFFSRVDGSMRTGIFSIDYITYWFDDNGVMQTGWYEEDGKKYYFNEDGKRASGFRTIGEDTYFFSRVDDNPMRTGVFSIDGVFYGFDSEGIMQTGWFDYAGNRYYFESDGRASTGFKTIEGKTYFFSRVDAYMRTGIFSIDYITYWFDDKGVMQTGWYEEDGKKYYFDEDGKRASGFRTIGEDTYFFSRVDDNPMRTGVFSIDGVFYGFDSEGIMQTGWFDYAGNRYYFESDGRASTGFKTIEGKTYFFSRVDAHMRTGIFVIDGPTYYFDNNGWLYKKRYNPIYYSQKDSRWSYIYYGSGNLKNTGCAPTSLAMAFSGILGYTVLPTDVANYLYYNTNEFNKAVLGASGLSVVYSSNYYGVPCTGLGTIHELITALDSGKTVIAYVGPGRFTIEGLTHAIVLTDYQNNQVYALDPYNTYNNGWIDINLVWSQQSTNSYDTNGGFAFYALG